MKQCSLYQKLPREHFLFHKKLSFCLKSLLMMSSERQRYREQHYMLSPTNYLRGCLYMILLSRDGMQGGMILIYWYKSSGLSESSHHSNETKRWLEDQDWTRSLLLLQQPLASKYTIIYPYKNVFQNETWRISAHQNDPASHLVLTKRDHLSIPWGWTIMFSFYNLIDWWLMSNRAVNHYALHCTTI